MTPYRNPQILKTAKTRQEYLILTASFRIAPATKTVASKKNNDQFRLAAIIPKIKAPPAIGAKRVAAMPQFLYGFRPEALLAPARFSFGYFYRGKKPAD